MVIAPFEWPAAPISLGFTRPDNGPPFAADAASTDVITKLMSPGWFERSDSSAPPGVAELVSGNVGAATTKPWAAQYVSSEM